MEKIFELKPLLSPLSDLEKFMRKCSAPWMIIGGVAVSLVAEPRFTADVDVVVLVEDADLEKMFKLMGDYGFEPRIKNALEFAQQNRVLLLKHTPSGIQLDMSLGLLPFERKALARSHLHKIETMTVRLPTIEDLIIFKAVAHRSKDLIDIQELIRHSDHPLDIKYITQHLREFSKILERDEILTDVKKLLLSKEWSPTG